MYGAANLDKSKFHTLRKVDNNLQGMDNNESVQISNTIRFQMLRGGTHLIRYGVLISICMRVLKYVVLLPRGNNIVIRGNSIANRGKEIKRQGNKIVSQGNRTY